MTNQDLDVAIEKDSDISSNDAEQKEKSLEQLVSENQALHKEIENLKREIDNFEEISKGIHFREESLPELQGFDIYGKEIPLNGVIGGDHIIFLNFNKRFELDKLVKYAEINRKEKLARTLDLNRNRAGILISDVPGHQRTDGAINAMLHQMFLSSVEWDLKYNGEVTPETFHIINNRFFKTSAVNKSFSMLYGEINIDGTFKFINSAHPAPIVYSRQQDRVVDIGESAFKTYNHVGFQMSTNGFDKKKKSTFGYFGKFEVNRMQIMGSGDIMLLYTDGLIEHTSVPRGEIPLDDDDSKYEYANVIEDRLKQWKDLSARQICDLISFDVKKYGKPEDDISYVIVKKL